MRSRIALLVLAGALTYTNSLSGPFIFDDRDSILENTTIEDWRDAARVLAPPAETPVAGRPAVNATFAANYALGGRRPAGYHAVNVAIHIACGLVLFGIVRRTVDAGSRRTRPTYVDAADVAFAVALIWLVHPLASEAVDYLSQRTESLMALFYVLTVYCAIRARQSVVASDFSSAEALAKAVSRTSWTVAAIGACALGMASKESMVTAPLMVVLYDRVFVFDSFADARRERRLLYGGLAATWLVLAALLATSPRAHSAGFTAHDADAWTYLLNQSELIVRYLRLAVWPRDLVLYYGWPRALTIADVWPYAIAVGGLLAATVAALVRAPRVGFLGAWFFVTLAPASSLLPIATEVGAERRMYLPLMALAALAVAGAMTLARIAFDRRMPDARLKPSRSKVFTAIALAAVAAALAAGTVSRNAEYRSSLRLAETSYERWPSPGSQSMLGTELAAAGRLTEAETHLREAAPAHPPARFYLGLALMTAGRLDEAARELQAFVDTQPPELDQVKKARVHLADIHRRLARAAIDRQQFPAAIDHYRAVLAEHADDVQALAGLAIALANTGRLAEALAPFRRVAELDAGNSHAHYNLARALAAHGDRDEAIAHAQRAADLAPGDPAPMELIGQLRSLKSQAQVPRSPR